MAGIVAASERSVGWWAPDLVGQDSSDETLCRRVADGDEAAFDTLVARHQARAYRLAWSLLRNAEDARDISQEAFLRVYRTAATFRGDARFSTWFHRIVVNLCLDHRRRGQWWRRLVGGGPRPDGDDPIDALPARSGDPTDDLARDQVMARVWAALDGLPPQQRAALVLHVQEELPTREVAEILACSEATVRVHLHRAVRALRKTLRRD